MTDLAARSVRVGTAPIADGGGRVLDRRLVPVAPGLAVAGPAFTVWCAPGDNLALQVAVADVVSGSVLVVQAGGPDAATAVWGEVLTVAAVARGAAGVVLDGCTRDVDAIVSRRFGLWCAGRSPAGPTKAGPGQVGGPVEVGGVVVTTDDWVVADGDGVVVIARDELAVALDAAEAKAHRETEWFAAIRDGSDTIELLGLDTSSIERR